MPKPTNEASMYDWWFLTDINVKTYTTKEIKKEAFNIRTERKYLEALKDGDLAITQPRESRTTAVLDNTITGFLNGKKLQKLMLRMLRHLFVPSVNHQG